MKKNGKSSQENNLKKFLLGNLFAIASALVALVNIWLASKLSPLAQDLKLITGRVSAAEQRQDKSDDNILRLEEKLDKVIWEIGNLKQYCH